MERPRVRATRSERCLRSNGGDAMALCGSPKRGFCRFIRKGQRRAAACHYRAQRADAARADVVLFAGGSALSHMPPEWTARKLPAHIAVIDPETGEAVAPELVAR